MDTKCLLAKYSVDDSKIRLVLCGNDYKDSLIDRIKSGDIKKLLNWFLSMMT